MIGGYFNKRYIYTYILFYKIVYLYRFGLFIKVLKVKFN
jgi:hypothetical protein